MPTSSSKEAIALQSSLAQRELATKRTAILKKWANRARELETQESALHATMRPDVAGILAPQRLLLWKEIFPEFNYPDMGVFSLVKPKDRPVQSKKATCYGEQTKAQASKLRAEVLSRVTCQGPEVDSVVAAKTAEECAKGWLVGLIGLGDLPCDGIIIRRFGLQQSSKVRLIDDFSISRVNATVCVAESPKPHSVDILAAMSLEMLRLFPNQNLVGKAFDLKSAYRQLAVSPESSWASYVAMWGSASSKPAVFRLRALPFGASKSVYSFLRVAHSLWWIDVKALRIAWTYYFDDFVCISCDEVAKHTDHCVCAFFHLLGWAFATEGDKFSPFNSSFQARG